LVSADRASMEGGKTQILHAGDLMHVPADIPHWIKVVAGESYRYLVVKVK
jgi:quercetin dioxygenase-like cupin family protein